MFNDASIAVVVPVYNEESFIADTIASIPSYVDWIYVIDDASTDGTWAEIRRVIHDGGDADRIVAIQHDRNRGVGGAIKTGYRRAAADGCDAVAVMAGDGQMDPDILPDLLTPVTDGTAAYAKGNRLHRPEDRRPMPRWRIFGNAVLTMLTRISSGYWQMTDPQNGYTVIHREAIESIPLDQLYNRYGFLNDLLATLNAYEFRIADVAHPAVYGDERSMIRYRTFVPALSWLLLRRFLWRLKTRYLVRGFHPVVLCYPLGVGASVLGSGIMAASLIGTIGRSVAALTGALAIVLLGCLLLVMAMWFDIDDNDGLVIRREAGSRSEPVETTEHPTAPTAVLDGGTESDSDATMYR